MVGSLSAVCNTQEEGGGRHSHVTMYTHDRSTLAQASSGEALELAKTNPKLYSTVGVHPVRAMVAPVGLSMHAGWPTAALNRLH